MARRARRRRNPSLIDRIRIDTHAMWLAARDRRTPWHARAFGLLVAAYALSPIDLIPDFIPILGLVDDATCSKSIAPPPRPRRSDRGAKAGC